MDEHRTRVRIFAGVVLVVLGILGIRLVQLQLVDTEVYTGESRSNAIRKRTVPPARGVIYDRTNTLLVANEPSYTIRLTPYYFDPEKTALLADLLAVSDSLVTQRLKEARAWSPFRPSRSFRAVSFGTFSKIQEHLYELPGVSYEVEQKRHYHTEARLTHGLGYLREIGPRALDERPDYRQGDRVGQLGLEESYEDELRGRPGSEYELVNVRGMEVESYRNGAEDQRPQSGYDLQLTVDHNVQALAESLFVNKRGSAVALDPNTGGILAMVSAPNFDLGLFSQTIEGAVWDSLRTHPAKPLFNRATMSGIPPGSTWKPFMSLIALEEGLITANTRLDCPAGYRLGRRIFRNHGGEDFGRITVKKALEVSCNTFYYELMQRLDVDTLHDWALKFGFGQRVPIDIRDQQPGLIPDSSYYNRTYGTGRWTAGYTVNLGIGQGDMSVTPVQLARYATAIANGGTLHPLHLVKEMRHSGTGEVLRPNLPPPEQIPIDATHFATVREGMRRVMEEGTGRFVQIPDTTSGGKTGTAQNPHGEDHSLFIMYAPAEDPQIAIAVMVENAGYGATAAAPIASLMAEQYLNGEIDTSVWQRRYWIDRLMNEERSAPIQAPMRDGEIAEAESP